MPDLSMLVLKRRSIWSNDSPSRGSTCISVSVVRRHGECAFCLRQLTVSATVLAQGIWRWVVEGYLVGFVAQLLEIAHQRLQSTRVATMCRQHPPRACVEGAG